MQAHCHNPVSHPSPIGEGVTDWNVAQAFAFLRVSIYKAHLGEITQVKDKGRLHTMHFFEQGFGFSGFGVIFVLLILAVKKFYNQGEQ